MPNFGWKCFIGSFLFSLAAVFVATRVYFALSDGREISDDVAFANIESKNIELFAQKEEFDNEDFGKEVTDTLEIAEQGAEDGFAVAENKNEIKISDVAGIADVNNKNNNAGLSDVISTNDDEILYTPEDTAEEADVIISVEDEIGNSPEKINIAASKFNEAIKKDISDNDEALIVDKTDTSDELKIADASEAKPFVIPLIHNYNTNKSSVSVSSSADQNQIAMASQNVALKNLGTQNEMAELTIEDSPWEVAEVSNEHITKNKMLEKTVKEIASEKHEEVLADVALAKVDPEKETKVAYKVSDNVLIPIPDEIKNNDNLTPLLNYSEENKKLGKKLHLDNPSFVANTNKEEDDLLSLTESSEKTEKKKKKSSKSSDEKSKDRSKTLTNSIAEWFSSSAEDAGDDDELDEGDDNNSAFNRLLNLGKSEKKVVPSELKLSFQPNRAEISGQTLDWLRAFSESAVANENVFVEIRIDKSSSYELQHKRLNLLYSILINNGVDFSKINIIFTDREPNSFIIRNVRYASEESANKARRSAYNPWR